MYQRDKRIGLKTGQKLLLYKNRKKTGEPKEFLIEGEIGRGGSCIVYHGSYKDSIKKKHWVRLKECYPYQLELDQSKLENRKEDGGLEPVKNQKAWFQQKKKEFQAAYETQVEISREKEVTNLIFNPIEIYFGNQTLYSVMIYKEGMDYGKVQKETIQETLQRGYAIANALEKYHEIGYLHLDVKPENIWIFPETKELVQLLDFDSLVKINQCKGKKFSYTEGFAAPELITKELQEDIGVVTDVYGLGALLFFKLMGRYARYEEKQDNFVYDFSELQKDKRICSKFFKELTFFFHKTLEETGLSRFQTMKEVKKQLEKLIQLADVSRVYPISNFVYQQDHFIGREEELIEIKERLQQKHILFLHGIGGIGKTELAMRYVYENKEEYDTKLFLPYEHTLEDSLCSEEHILICNFTKEPEEKQKDYWKRKIKVLKESLSFHDLLVLDNFDTEEDENLNEFLELPCQILITTRNDFSDWNYPQMEVSALDGMRELTRLFKIHNPKIYSKQEQKAIRTIIKLVDFHTMTVELIAKNLRDSNISPLQFEEQLKKESGIMNIGTQPVRHRKDRKQRHSSIQEHLKVLFNMSNFKEEEFFILEKLSMKAGLWVEKKEFLAWCNCSEEDVDALIRRGWIETNRNGEENKISLHQIILDLVWEEVKR